jgi:hypothetical protein
LKARYLVETELELFVDVSPVGTHGCQPQAQAAPVLDLLASCILQLACKPVATRQFFEPVGHSTVRYPLGTDPNVVPVPVIRLIALKLRKKLKMCIKTKKIRFYAENWCNEFRPICMQELCDRKHNNLKLKVHKIENFFGFDFEICTFS